METGIKKFVVETMEKGRWVSTWWTNDLYGSHWEEDYSEAPLPVIQSEAETALANAVKQFPLDQYRITEVNEQGEPIDEKLPVEAPEPLRVHVLIRELGEGATEFQITVRTKEGTIVPSRVMSITHSIASAEPNYRPAITAKIVG